jgi:3-hydroxyisobutyrate dehydrogenase
MSNVGVVGLGPMGMAAARALLRAGFSVHACDPHALSLQSFVAAGGKAGADPAALAAAADILVLVLANIEQVEAVLFGRDGAADVLPTGAVVVVSAAVPPDYPVTVSGRLAERGILMLDAPMSGAGLAATHGVLSIMASGPEAAFDKAATVLDAIAEKVYRVGEQPGQGSSMKMLNQLLIGLHIAATAEAMALGIRIGCSPAAIYDVISHSLGSSVIFENRVPHMLAGDYTLPHTVDTMVKDLGIVLDAARKSTFPLPLTAAAHQQFLAAAAAGHGGAEDVALIKVFQALTGIRLPARA